MTLSRRMFSTLALLALVGCSDPASTGGGVTLGYSGPVTIRLDKFKDGEVRNGVFDSDKNINTESGNPYGAFLQAARATIGANFTADNASAAIGVERITLTIAEDTRGVSAFEQILGGPLVVYFASSAATVNVGTVAQPRGAGPVEVILNATLNDLEPLRRDLLNGSFKVGVRVPAATSLPERFDMRVSTVLTFRAVLR